MAKEVYHPTPPETYWRLRRVMRWMFYAISRPTVSGLENFPAEGPVLMVTNHLSLFDPPAIFVTMPRQGVVFVTSKHKKNPVIAAIARAAGCIWVDRGEADRAALKAALDVLKQGFLLGLAPEGTRSPTHSLQRGKTGVAYIATRANAPILPLVTWGVEQIRYELPRGRRAEVFVKAGPVFRLPDDPRAKGGTLDEYTTEIMCHVAALLPEKYRGVYADQPRLRALIDSPSARC